MTAAPRRLRFMIVGVARSGTTLVQRLASELDGVWVPPESHFWRHAAALAREVDWPLTPDGAGDLFAAFESLPGLCDFTFDPDVARSLLPESPWLWDVFEAVTVAAAPTHAHVIGEKTPAHHRWAHRLLAETDSLRVIGIRRDPYETFASHLDLSWGVKDPVEFAVRWRMADEELRVLERGFPDRVLVLDHHAVARDPGDAQRHIAGLLGIEAQTRDSTLDDAGRLFDATETWKASATGEIRPSERDRADLPPDHAEWIRAIVDDDIEPGQAAEVAAARSRERRLAASSALPLPLNEPSRAAWQASDHTRARAWQRQADKLRADLDRADHRVAAAQEQAAAAAADAGRWRERAEELNAEQKHAAAQLAAALARAEHLRGEVTSLQGRRVVRAADALGRLRPGRRRH